MQLSIVRNHHHRIAHSEMCYVEPMIWKKKNFFKPLYWTKKIASSFFFFCWINIFISQKETHTGTTWNSWAFAHLFPKLEPLTKMDQRWRQAQSCYKKQPRRLTNELRNYPLFSQKKKKHHQTDYKELKYSAILYQ